MKFILNWSGPHIQDMNVDDRVCQTALIKLLRALEDLQPTIEGILLGVSEQSVVFWDTLMSRVRLKQMLK